MIEKYIRYGALSAKVRAMYGKRLSEEDFGELLKKQTVSDIAGFLKKHPAYEKPLSNIDEKLVHRGQLENILKRILFNEYLKIFNYTFGNDDYFFKNLIVRLEIEEIINCMRLLKSGRIDEFILTVPEFLIKISKLNFVKMSAAKSFEDILEVLKKTEYHKILSEYWKDAQNQIDITSLEIALNSFYYDQLYEQIKEQFMGAEKETLLENTGTQIDLLNITYIMRMKKYFSISPETIHSYLLPFNHKLKEKELNLLINAKNEEEIFAVLELTKYKDYFSRDNKQLYIEDYYFKLMYRLHKRLIRSGTPTVNVPLAYLFLKDIEIKNIINIIEGVRYKQQPELIKKHLTGIQ